MPMMNKDLMNKTSNKFFQDLSEALKNDDHEAAAKALQSMQESICGMIEAEFEQYNGVADMAILQQRGLRVLTSEETSWYQKFIGAVKEGAKQEITNLTAAMPVTIIDRVIEDMRQAHPLLGALTIQNAAGAQKLILNGIQMASKLGTWGQITAAISEELSGAIKIVDITVAKYSAYIPIPKDFVRFNFSFAPMWVDQYVRILLSECVAFGLEKASITGTGKNEPIGADRDITQATNGVHPQKTATAIANFDTDYANEVAKLAVDGNGDTRMIPQVLMIVNPKDYIRKIRRFQNTLVYGTGPVDVIDNTYPTRVVQSVFVPENKAIIGIAKNYFMAINGGQSGIIEYDDSNQFLEDNRVYTTRLYGYGQPVDNTSFEVLDITNVTAPALPVFVAGGSVTTVTE